MSSSVQEQKSHDPLSLREAYKARCEEKTAWKEKFDTYHRSVAQKIADSIAKEVFEKFTQRVNDPYQVLPDSKHEARFSFSFRMKGSEAVQKLQSLAGDEASLPPFKEWFEVFGKKEEKVEHKHHHGADSDDEIGPSSSAPRKVEDLDRSYFDDTMAVVGERVRAFVHKELSHIRQHNQNEGFLYRVEWKQKSMNPSDSSKNTLRVSLWLDTEDGELEVEEPVIQPKSSSWFGCCRTKAKTS
ncbi:MAG: hypothetical protein KGJ02_06050 [Verrucomicrobiota bacterium]|nr:hypothetical protein [Verrucomicrobiota bacterium]